MSRKKDIWMGLLCLSPIFIGLGCCVLGGVIEQRDRVALPGMAVFCSGLGAVGLWGVLKQGGVHNYRRNRFYSKAQAPFRYGAMVTGMALLAIGGACMAIAGFLGLASFTPPDAPPPPESGKVDLLVTAIWLSPLLLSFYCWWRALDHRRENSDWSSRKFLRPRHITPKGYPWLAAYYLCLIMFVALMFMTLIIAQRLGGAS